MNPGLVGLSISYALQITQTLNWLVRMTSDVETNIVAVERIKEYGETPQEAAWEVSPGPPASWPDKGQVDFKNYQVRYREGLELVLKGVTFSVKGGEKVCPLKLITLSYTHVHSGGFVFNPPAGNVVNYDSFFPAVNWQSRNIRLIKHRLLITS
ncbi:Canalicular multispecific organic anion transporter 1 [Homalodisca vitripennis]|nr:Canalicular multispecific organic anion transporter 1 [Homalodisca vitripennis]